MICSRNPVSLHDMFEETQPPTVIYFSKSVLQVLLLCIYPYVLQRLQKQPSGRVLSTLSENPSKFTRKHLCRRFCLIMLQTYRLCSITKKRIPHMCFTEIFKNDLAWKVFKYGVFFGPYFPVFSPTAEKYRPEKTLCLDAFHAVAFCRTPSDYYFCDYFYWLMCTEKNSKEIARRCSITKLSLKILQNSQENTFIGVFFSIKLH